jgi:ABC-type transport system involved in Fe-S cluster assembly fused permease/ATPase subunit
MNACSSLDLGCSNLFIDGPAGVEMAHRLSTVMRADTIVVLQQGNIKEI